ncbi:MAG: arginase family protein [Candidatus Pacearchaeota archaeon]|jgi:arginase family enzyme
MIIIQAPAENSNDALGCRKAPEEIVKNLDDIYTGENGRQAVKEKLDIKKLEFNGKNDADVEEIIYQESMDLISNNDKVIFLGGDHSISYPIGKAFADVCESEDKQPFLIVFDAHPDCKDYGNNVANNVQWLRKLIDKGFPKDKIILIGLRKSSLEENMFLQENKIRVYQMKDLIDFQEICDIVMEQANKYQIYLSIDIDVVDSVFVPGTAHSESGGLTSRQLVYFIQRLNLLKGVKVIDIAEINPEKDFNNVTVKLGSKLLGEMIA